MKKLLIVLFTLFISACASTQAIVPQVQTQERLVVIPESLLMPCSTTTPPAIDSYLGKTKDEQKEMLRAYAVHLLVDLQKCNSQIKEIKSTQDQQKDALNKVNNH